VVSVWLSFFRRRAHVAAVVVLTAAWLFPVLRDEVLLIRIPFVALGAAGVTAMPFERVRGGRLLRLVAFLLYGGVGIVFSLAYALGSRGFDRAFLWHANLESLELGVTVFPVPSGIVAAALVVIAALGIWARDGATRPSWPAWIALAIGVTANPSLASAFKSVDATRGLNRAERLAVSRAIDSRRWLPPAKPKNVVLVYAESLERTLMNMPRMRGDLLPRLRAREAEGLVFDRV